ncbi:MAG: hypothetical protein JNM17_08810 [Archangium sp.]|nr:hypothetical protein [Archangium sp.]
MNRRRFAAPVQTPKPVEPAAPVPEVLSERLALGGRLPLDVSLSVAIEIVDAIATVHADKMIYGGFNAAELTVLPTGEVYSWASPKPGEDLSLDLFSAGTVLYQVFTGLTPNQARAKLSVPPQHAVPPAALVNPALDESISDLLAKMLDRDPSQRPHSLRLVEQVLEDVCEFLDLVPSRDVVRAWWESAVVSADDIIVEVAPAPAATPPAPRMGLASRPARFAEVAYDEDDEEEQNDDFPPPLRFDAWAAAACVFLVAAFGLATQL